MTGVFHKSCPSKGFEPFDPSTRCDMLSSFEVLRTADIDEARAAISSRFCDHKIERDRFGTLAVRHNHAKGQHVSVNLLSYGCAVDIHPGALEDFYLFQFPLKGQVRVVHQQQEIDTSPRVGAVLAPDRPTRLSWQANCKSFVLQIHSQHLNDVASEMVGGVLPGPVRFDPCIDLTKKPGHCLARLTILLAQAFDNGHLTPTRTDLRMMHVERELVRHLLNAQPSNMSHLIENIPKIPPQKALRAAIDFIHRHFGAPIRLSDIARAANLHERNLQAAFRVHIGLSPMAYLRNLRLDMAKYWLMQDEPNRPRVADIAHGCGYTHLGRFSKDYRERFGGVPSQAHLSKIF